MDSGNSGSMQSSSGGDEEYADSRTEPLSSFFTPSSSTAPASAAAAALPNLQQQPPPPPPPFFDSLSYLDAFHLDAAAFSRPFLPSSSMRAPLDHPNPNPTLTASTAPAAAPRSSKKRSRASRRAPTTVLTTDTSNFRAMVQEFTGIPSPPFSSSSSSSFPRSRFDFFHPSSSTASPSSALPNPPPPFLLKPFPQKFQTHPAFNPISSSPPITATTAAAATSTSNANTITNSAPTNYNYQNPILNFQSLLQSPLTNMPAFITKPQPPPATAADYGVTDLGVPGLIGSGWADGLGPEATSDHAHSRQVVGNYGSSKVSSSCKLNYSGPGSTSDFHAEKGSEGRGEGMVESWICSSD